MNLFGGVGYLTEEQRKAPLKHTVVHFTFKTCVDLSEGVTIEARGEYPENVLARETALFMVWWSNNILQDLNGWIMPHSNKFKVINIHGQDL